MLSSLATFFNKTSPTELLESKRPNAKKHIIYRDELSKATKPATKSKPSIKKANSSSLDSSEPLLNKEEGKGVIRVKVMMTKREANRLLSRCKDGGVLDFKDVARELVQIPVSRVSVLDDAPSSFGRGSSGTVLKSIPEEF